VTGAVEPDGPVERALDELFDGLAGTGREGRHVLAEVEDHLRSAVAEGEAAGLTGAQAERVAVDRFGPLARVAAEVRAVRGGPGAWLRPAFVGCWLAGGLGLLAVGASGLLAEVSGRLFGAGFVAGNAPGVTYTPMRCADYFEYFPHASSCADAAALHHWGEVVESRVAAGVLGLLALLVLWLARRGTRLGGPAWTPPRGTVLIPMAGLFGLAGIALVGYGLLQLASGDHAMVGANLSAGVASAAAAVAAGASAVARRRRTA
jgi:hypothetical protein